MNMLEISGLSKHYESAGVRTDVLSDINLKVREGEFIAIVGYSGSGKTTLISALAGLIEPDAGGVVVNGREIDGPGPERGVVFQSYSLMPWLSVYDNVALAVNEVCRNLSRTERRNTTSRYIEMVGLSHAKTRKPAELSGGMRQRVAVARALATQPAILLLDEPLSALDALTRAKLQDELAEISQKENCTIVLITNDVDEAILLADRIIPLTPGPGATLGPEFEVELSRPRDRSAINSSQQFMKLRSEITNCLVSYAERQPEEHDFPSQLPNIVPITQSGFVSRVERLKASYKAQTSEDLPRAYTEASKSNQQDKYLNISQVKKVYPTPEGPLTVVDGFDLQLNKGEFVTLIGHSGCGKSTVLSMVAGLNEITQGAVVLDGRHTTQAGPDRAVVFQAPSLLPWLTAYENVALGVDRVYPDASRDDRHDVIEYYLDRVGLRSDMHKNAADLSNGMKQRVGIARAFALSPKLLLLDEPFGMLDSLTRWELQDVLMEVWTRTQVTTVCVTHDVDEAILLADRVIMMSNGPSARIGNVMEVDLPRPRSRQSLLAHEDYYAYREELLDFLDAYEGGANPDEDQLLSIQQKRATRLARQRQTSLAQQQAPNPQLSQMEQARL